MRVEDRLEIYELISMYAMSYDHNMIDEHVSLFTEDGTLVLSHEATGHEAIRKMTGERRAKIAEKGIQNRHFLRARRPEKPKKTRIPTLIDDFTTC